MAANTSKGITYPTSSDSIASLETVFATMANTTNTALTSINASTDITQGILPVARGGTGGDSVSFRAGKNKVLNGDFNIWQRTIGTAYQTINPGFYADQFYFTGSTGFTQQKLAFTPGAAPVSGYESRYYYNVTLTANNQNAELLQRIEDARTLSGQRVTLSFWARSTAGQQVVNSGLYQNFGTGGSPSAVQAATSVSGQTYTWTADSTWRRYTFVQDLPSVAGKTFGTNDNSYLWVRIFQLSATTTNTSIDIWGVQLEAGSVATDFIIATGNPASELAACQRYYQLLGGKNNNDVLGTGTMNTSTTGYFVINHKATMRANPTIGSGNLSNIKIAGGAGQYALSTLTLAVDGRDASILGFTCAASGYAANAAFNIFASGTGYVELVAEIA